MPATTPGYEGGVRRERAKEVRAKQPARIVERRPCAACCPETKMGEAMWRKLKVYAGDTHPHAATKPAVRRSSTRSEVA